MMPNALTTEVGFKVGPVLLEVLAKHYMDRHTTKEGEQEDPKLRKDDILYDEGFSIVKAFLNASSWHTVEDLQAFSNTRTPSPPWIHVIRTVVPMSCCDTAATHLIKAFGGEDVCRKVVGGVRWWQVRGINGVDAQWISAKKDWEEAKRRHKQRGEAYHSQSSNEEATYVKDMDAMRCILYIHGGGYYFGSVDQERYSIQRLARKINGRVFAINYRLAPQYPFPCAIQDALASYLYLINPPPGAEHQPVDPVHIVIAGDSAGGGLALALLQVIRDSGLEAPAGGVLISPWCDLTHSFPSILLNTKTDVIPDCGLSFHKPSPLWPPPPPEFSKEVHATIRGRLRQLFRADGSHVEQMDTVSSDRATPAGISAHSNSIDKICLSTSTERLEVDNQIQFYTRNSLLVHPLVSPALSYLGNLPPLLFIVSDKEVLRDEIVYTAHRAANPSKFPIRKASEDLYPALKAFPQQKPTSVHIQIYDDTAHVLPILFAFTTPAKYCFRAMANFCKLVTEMPLSRPAAGDSSLASLNGQGNDQAADRASLSDSSASQDNDKRRHSATLSPPGGLSPSRPSLRRAISSRISRASYILKHRNHSGGFDTPVQAGTPSSMSIDGEWVATAPQAPSDRHNRGATTSTDVAGPRFGLSSTTAPNPGQRLAGDVSVYQSIKDLQNWECGMIRERVSTEGIIRPLEPEAELKTLHLLDDTIGRISEPALRRYIDNDAKYKKKFAHTYKRIEKHRKRNIERSKSDTEKRMRKMKKSMEARDDENRTMKTGNYKDYLISSPGWSCTWALDDHENPPPSSIVARRDTEEARQLAEFADRVLLEPGGDHTFSGNNLWSVIINFFTVMPEKSRLEVQKTTQVEEGSSQHTHRAKVIAFFKVDRNNRNGKDV